MGTRLTEDIVYWLRFSYQAGVSVRDIAEEENLPYTTVWDVVHCKTWAHLGKRKENSDAKRTRHK